MFSIVQVNNDMRVLLLRRIDGDEIETVTGGQPLLHVRRRTSADYSGHSFRSDHSEGMDQK